MSKPIVEPIVFTQGDDEYRSTLKSPATKGDRTSFIAIKKGFGSFSFSSILLYEISPEDEIRLFNLISQSWWIHFKKLNRGTNEIYSQMLKSFKYLVSEGVEEQHALRSTIVFDTLEFENELTLETAFQEFSSVGIPFMVNRRGFSNFERFLEIARKVNVESAKTFVRKSGSDFNLLDSKYIMLTSLQENSQAVDYLASLSEAALSNLQIFKSFVNMKLDVNAAPIVKMISEISESQWAKVEDQVELLHQYESIINHLDPRDVDAWVSHGEMKGLARLIEDSLGSQHIVGSRRLLCILMARFDLNTLTVALKVTNDDRTAGKKSLADVLHVCKFIEEGGSLQTPLSWMIAISSDTAGQ